MNEKKLNELLKAAGEAFEILKVDIGKTAEDIVTSTKSTCNDIKKTVEETLKEMGESSFLGGKVSSYNTGKQFFVTILTGKGFIKESLSVKVVKSDLLLNVDFVVVSGEESLKFKEKSSFEINVPEICDFEKGVKASIKEGYLVITFEIKEKETDTVKVDIS